MHWSSFPPHLWKHTLETIFIVPKIWGFYKKVTKIQLVSYFPRTFGDGHLVKETFSYEFSFKSWGKEYFGGTHNHAFLWQAHDPEEFCMFSDVSEYCYLKQANWQHLCAHPSHTHTHSHTVLVSLMTHLRPGEEPGSFISFVILITHNSFCLVESYWGRTDASNPIFYGNTSEWINTYVLRTRWQAKCWVGKYHG